MWQSTCSACPGPSDVESTMRPLDGIKVITLEHAIAAPFCTRQLADLGARVIKVERPRVRDFARAYDERVRGLASHFVWTNRSKESLARMSSTRRPSASWPGCWRAPTCWCRTSHPAPRHGWACPSRCCGRHARG